MVDPAYNRSAMLPLHKVHQLLQERKPPLKVLINGDEYPAYPPAVFARALDITRDLLRWWIQQGIIPPSPFKVLTRSPFADYQAVYLRQQILGVWQILNNYRTACPGQPLRKTFFYRDVKEFYDKLIVELGA